MFGAFFQPFILPTNERKAFCSCLLLLDFISQRLRVFHSEMNWKSKSKAYNKNCINSEVYWDHTESVGGGGSSQIPQLGFGKVLAIANNFILTPEPFTFIQQQWIIISLLLLLQLSLSKSVWSFFPSFLRFLFYKFAFQFAIFNFQFIHFNYHSQRKRRKKSNCCIVFRVPLWWQVYSLISFKDLWSCSIFSLVKSNRRAFLSVQICRAITHFL